MSNSALCSPESAESCKSPHSSHRIEANDYAAAVAAYTERAVQASDELMRQCRETLGGARAMCREAHKVKCATDALLAERIHYLQGLTGERHGSGRPAADQPLLPEVR